MVTIKPNTSLCDGTFHKISGKKQHLSLINSSQDPNGNILNSAVFFTVIKRKNVVQLHVDTVDNYKIGPPSPATARTKSSLYVGGIPGE